MKLKERIIHSVLFEIGAVVIGTVAVLLFSHEIQTDTALIINILISCIAMLWNIIFNWGFDKIFTGDRLARSLGVRAFQAIGFELGLMCLTIPIVMYLLQLNLWQAILADLGLSILIMIYAFVFNWIYDILREKLKN